MGAYLELVVGVLPCSLCIIQRIIMALLGTLFFIGTFVRLKKLGYTMLGSLSLVTSIMGILFSGRQVFLQHMPAMSGGECGINLFTMFEIFPFMTALQHVWRGGLECSQLGWVFILLSIAEWALILFCIFFLMTLIQL